MWSSTSQMVPNASRLSSGPAHRQSPKTQAAQRPPVQVERLALATPHHGCVRSAAMKASPVRCLRRAYEDSRSKPSHGRICEPTGARQRHRPSNGADGHGMGLPRPVNPTDGSSGGRANRGANAPSAWYRYSGLCGGRLARVLSCRRRSRVPAIRCGCCGRPSAPDPRPVLRAAEHDRWVGRAR
jgi:hypothetical protein